MITGMGNAAEYHRPASIYSSTSTSTPADAMQVPDPALDHKGGIAVANLRQLDAGPARRPPPEILDQWAAMWLSENRAASTPMGSDDAPQNTYAEIKVDGQVVGTLFNDGSATMTGTAAAKIGDLKDPESLSGPNLAQWRADAYARVLGGTVEKAATAISQSQWTPHPSPNTNYTRAQRDQGLAGYFAENQKLMAAPTPKTDLNA
jgi:hypothetical protein